MLHYVGIEQFCTTPLVRQPFEHLIVPQFIPPCALAEINGDYPTISTSGSFPVDQVVFGPAFQTLLDELNSDEFREAFEEKFGLDLAGRPTITTVRGRCGPGDGKIHTDSATKIITALIYMNETWDQPGGRLRLLRSSHISTTLSSKCPRSRERYSRSSAATIHGMATYLLSASAASFNSIGLHRKAIAKSLCFGITLPPRSSVCCRWCCQPALAH